MRRSAAAAWRWGPALAGWLLALAALAAQAQPAAALQVAQWIDAGGQQSVEAVAGRGAEFQPVERSRALSLAAGALWLRVQVPALPAGPPWYLTLAGAASIDRASLFVALPQGGWREQVAGDHVPVARWSHPNFTPLFELPPGGATTVWLRLANHPAPVGAHLQLLSEDELQEQRRWTYLLAGAYLGFGLLVVLLALMHGRLYADVAFDSYAAYVACMLLFQLAYTGVGALFLWPSSARFNDAAPALFMLWMVAAGIWNIRKSTALQRHGRGVDRAVLGFSLFGLVLPLPYLLLDNAATYALLNLYGLASVVLSIALTLWTWRRGEAWSGWLFLGFLPVHLAYPFPALRAAGLLPGNWATQYAVLIGSAIEIPLLLYVLHRRARDYSENRARMRALDSTDPLTGLVAVPVLQLRLRDALRRARRLGTPCAVLLVELANHGEIAAAEGREAADRALVVTGARLSQVVREVDTVCRIAETRFALLIDGARREDQRHLLAQHVVARGLERVPRLPPELPLRFKVVTAWVPGGAGAADEAQAERQLLDRMGAALDQLLREPRRVLHHLDAVPPPAGPRPAAATARAPAAADGQRPA